MAKSTTNRKLPECTNLSSKLLGQHMTKMTMERHGGCCKTTARLERPREDHRNLDSRTAETFAYKRGKRTYTRTHQKKNMGNMAMNVTSKKPLQMVGALCSLTEVMFSKGSPISKYSHRSLPRLFISYASFPSIIALMAA